MKKYFSLTMLLAMVLTLVSTVPAQAALDNTYPYIFLDYNTSVDQIEKTEGTYGTTAVAEWAESKGVGGTGALKITDRNHNRNDGDLVTSNLLDKESITRDSYKISGWVKLVHANKLDTDGNIINGEDGKPAQWELTNDVTFGTVLNYGYTGGGTNTYSATKFSNISTPSDLTQLTGGKWYYFEQTYTKDVDTFTSQTASGTTYTYDWTTSKNTNFQFRFLGKTSDSRFFQIFDGFYRYLIGSENSHSSSGNTEHRGELLYYVDDYQYIPVVSDTLVDGSVPVVTPINSKEIDTFFVDDTIHISWGHTPTSTDFVNTVTDSKVVVRVFKEVKAGGEYATNGWALVDQLFADGNSYSYPLTADMLGNRYKFEVFPYDSVVDSEDRPTYRAGAIQTFTMKKEVSKPEIVTPADTPITFTPLETGGKITFQLAEVTNNRATSLDLFTIIALYDNKGALIDCKVNPLTVPGDGGTLTENGPVTHSETLNADVYDKVASAKAFVWGGSSFDDTVSHKAYTEPQSKTK